PGDRPASSSASGRTANLPVGVRHPDGPEKTKGSAAALPFFGSGVYDSTWGAEGSRTRRMAMHAHRDGSTPGGVGPARRDEHAWPSDSGAETALPATLDRPGAGAAQRRPGAEAQKLDLGSHAVVAAWGGKGQPP